MTSVVCPSLSDVEGIQDVFYRSWKATYPNVQFGITLEDIEQLFADRHSPEKHVHRRAQIVHPLRGEFMYVAKEGPRVVGVCRVMAHEYKNMLQALYVLPEYEGRGIGTSLWQKSCEVLDHARPIHVWLAPYCDKAKRFYNKLGFVEEDDGEISYNTKIKMPVSERFMPQMLMTLRPAL